MPNLQRIKFTEKNDGSYMVELISSLNNTVYYYCQVDSYWKKYCNNITNNNLFYKDTKEMITSVWMRINNTDAGNKYLEILINNQYYYKFNYSTKYY